MYLRGFVGRKLTLQEMWTLMDQEWDRCGTAFGLGSERALSAFYSSPVWLLNGLFTDCDPESVSHGDSMSEWISSLTPGLIADYGGGYGSLGRKIAMRLPLSQVLIVEPYPRKEAVRLASQFRPEH